MGNESLASSLSEAIIQHFDAHQKGYFLDAGRQRKKNLVIDSVQSRADLLLQLVSKHGGGTVDAVENEVLSCVKAALAASSSSSSDNEAIDRILDLASVFSFKFSRPCYSGLWSVAIQASQSTIVPLRSKGCFLIGRCLESISDSEEEGIVTEYCKLAEKTITPRLSDKNHLVRCAAIYACQYCFINEQQYWPAKIEEGLIVAMAHDASFANRVAAVKSVPITEDTIPFIVERIRDIKPKVRESALSVLQTKVEFDQLHEQQRIEILLSGLTERCPTTYEATVKLLCCNWMKRFKFDPLELIRNLIPVENERGCEKCIKAIIHAADDDSNRYLTELSAPEREALKENVQASSKGIKTSLIDPAKALFLQVHFSMIIDSEAFSPSSKSERISQILPDLATLCDVFQTQLEQHVRARMNDDANEDDKVETVISNSTFICSQLLMLAKKSDIQEEAGLRRLASLIHTMLCSSETPEELIEPSVQTLACMQSSEADFIRCVSEAVLEVGCSSDSTNKEEVASRQIRVLSIMSIAMENIALTEQQKPLLQGFPDRILPLLTSEDAMVKQAAISCLGKYTLFADKESFSPILLELTKNQQEKIENRAQALLGLCDLALLEDASLDDTSDVGNILLDFLNHEESALVIVAAEVCVKLLLSGKMQSQKILAQLIIIFFTVCDIVGDHSEDASDVGSPRRLQQILSIFFPAFCLSHESNRIEMLQTIKPLIRKSINFSDASGKKKKRSASLVSSIPKMIDFICSTVNMACPDDENSDDTEEELATENAFTNAANDLSANESTELFAAVSVSELLLENEELSVSNLRMVCKILASLAMSIDFDAAKSSSVQRKQTWSLKQNWEKLELLISDHYASASLEKLRDIMEQIDVTEDNTEIGCSILNTVSNDSDDVQEE